MFTRCNFSSTKGRPSNRTASKTYKFPLRFPFVCENLDEPYTAFPNNYWLLQRENPVQHRRWSPPRPPFCLGSHTCVRLHENRNPSFAKLMKELCAHICEIIFWILGNPLRKRWGTSLWNLPNRQWYSPYCHPNLQRWCTGWNPIRTLSLPDPRHLCHPHLPTGELDAEHSQTCLLYTNGSVMISTERKNIAAMTSEVRQNTDCNHTFIFFPVSAVSLGTDESNDCPDSSESRLFHPSTHAIRIE